MSSIRDVAKRAGVSTATVSRVLNNDQTYKMTEETRDRVWKAVAATGYKPHVRAEKARKKPSTLGSSVGCILSVAKGKYRDPYFTSIFSGIEERFEQKGFKLAFLKTYDELEDKELLRQTFQNPPAGLILMETLNPATYRYVCARVPACVGVDTLHDGIDNVGYDQFDTAARATRSLLEKGHRDIAFLGGSGLSGHLYGDKRYLGYASALQAAGLPLRAEWIRDCQWDEILCIEQVQQMMNTPPCPTAIFAGSDLMAMAALSSLYSMGISVPGQVAVLGLSDIELAKFSSPPLTTYAVPTREIGIIAVDMLEKRLLGEMLPPQRVLLPTRRINRASV